MLRWYLYKASILMLFLDKLLLFLHRFAHLGLSICLALCFPENPQKGNMFLSNLQLLLQKARHRDSDPAALAHFLKGLYFRRWKTLMLHTLYIDASCYEVSVSHMSNVLDLIFMVQWPLEKKFKIFLMLNSLLL